MEEKAFRHNATEHRLSKKSLAVHRGFTPFALNHYAMTVSYTHLIVLLACAVLALFILKGLNRKAK